jgi:hypothetical protein
MWGADSGMSAGDPFGIAGAPSMKRAQGRIRYAVSQEAPRVPHATGDVVPAIS